MVKRMKEGGKKAAATRLKNKVEAILAVVNAE
jgi:hypothetical protein